MLTKADAEERIEMCVRAARRAAEKLDLDLDSAEANMRSKLRIERHGDEYMVCVAVTDEEWSWV